MQTHADNVNEKGKRSAASGSSGNARSSASYQISDQRREAAKQLLLGETAENSPQVTQLKAFHAMADRCFHRKLVQSAGMVGAGVQALQLQWNDTVVGPDDFDAEEAAKTADWSNPKYASVNLGKVQPEADHLKSYRITVWAPAIVDNWEVTVAAHVYFEADFKTKKIKRTQYGHLYVNDWVGWDTEDDDIRATVYNAIFEKVLAKIGNIAALTNGAVTIAGKYDRASFSPKQV